MSNPLHSLSTPSSAIYFENQHRDLLLGTPYNHKTLNVVPESVLVSQAPRGAHNQKHWLRTSVSGTRGEIGIAASGVGWRMGLRLPLKMAGVPSGSSFISISASLSPSCNFCQKHKSSISKRSDLILILVSIISPPYRSRRWPKPDPDPPELSSSRPHPPSSPRPPSFS